MCKITPYFLLIIILDLAASYTSIYVGFVAPFLILTCTAALYPLPLIPYSIFTNIPAPRICPSRFFFLTHCSDKFYWVRVLFTHATPLLIHQQWYVIPLIDVVPQAFQWMDLWYFLTWSYCSGYPHHQSPYHIFLSLLA